MRLKSLVGRNCHFTSDQGKKSHDMLVDIKKNGIHFSRSLIIACMCTPLAKQCGISYRVATTQLSGFIDRLHGELVLINIPLRRPTVFFPVNRCCTILGAEHGVEFRLRGCVRCWEPKCRVTVL